MGHISFDRDAVQRAIAALHPQIDRLNSERTSLQRARQAAESGLVRARSDLFASFQGDRNWRIWNHANLDYIAATIAHCCATLEDMRSRVRAELQQLHDAHPGELRRHIEDFSSPVEQWCGQMMNAVWGVKSSVQFGNAVNLANQPWSLFNQFGAADYNAQAAATSLASLIQFLQRLLSDETTLLAALAADAVPQISGLALDLSILPSTYPIAGAIVASSYAIKPIWNYLGDHYTVSTVSGSETTGSLIDRKIGYEKSVSGNLWNLERNANGKMLGMNTSRKQGIMVADLAVAAGATASLKDGPNIGPTGEFTAFKAYENESLGSKQLGLTDGAEIRALSADGALGYHGGKLVAEVGVVLASVQGTAGINIAGANVGVVGEVGWKAELGLEVGAKTMVKLPFVSFGFDIGSAK